MKKPPGHEVTGGQELRERVKGIEPSCQAWEACVLPLNYTRLGEVLVPGRHVVFDLFKLLILSRAVDKDRTLDAT